MLKQLLKEALLQTGLYYRLQSYRRDERTANQREFYSNLIRSQDLVFDVGANIGQRTEIFSRLGRRVIAIEPQRYCLKHLRSRFMFCRNVAIEPVALSDGECEAVLYQNAKSHTLSTLSKHFVRVAGASQFQGEKWETEVLVKTMTLDRLIERYGVPRFIKIDVEGHEAAVIRGLSHCVDCISFEYNPGLIDEAKKAANWLRLLSPEYRWNYCVGEQLDYVLNGHVTHDEFLLDVLPAIDAQGCWGDIYAMRGVEWSRAPKVN